jgi:competence protein ComEA
MLGRTSVGTLGAITAALALAALAHIPARSPTITPQAAAARRSPAIASVSALRALRDGQRIDLNQASAGDLELLPGIGPSLAQRIVEERSAHGRFESVASLQRVRGIGPRTLERLGALVQVGAAAQGRAPAPAR